ncbi:hypothetical protein, partial [Pseudomonas veronii]|uniref:hypothetical protein n=1 Tax=Pseudomonas veronii TaxID=76761 RepID=UPI0021BFDE40
MIFKKQRLNRKSGHFSPSNTGFRPCEALRRVDSLHHGRTSPMIINCLVSVQPAHLLLEHPCPHPLYFSAG